jgi:hypothetical protein
VQKVGNETWWAVTLRETFLLICYRLTGVFWQVRELLFNFNVSPGRNRTQKSQVMMNNIFCLFI